MYLITPPISVPISCSPQKTETLRFEVKIPEKKHGKCDSVYAAPTVLLPKKDGTFPMCVDYRKLNNVNLPDKYPLHV